MTLDEAHAALHRFAMTRESEAALAAILVLDEVTRLRTLCRDPQQPRTRSTAVRHIALFRHPARLVRRAPGDLHRLPSATIFEFETTHLAVQLSSFGETSPFHDLPDSATVYVEIGVDAEFTQPEVKKVAEEFVRHGRRPKFGPPIIDADDTSLPGDPDPNCEGCQRFEYEKRELVDEVACLRQLLRDLVDFDMGMAPELDQLDAEYGSRQIARMGRAWEAAIAEVGPRNQRRFVGDEP